MKTPRSNPGRLMTPSAKLSAPAQPARRLAQLRASAQARAFLAKQRGMEARASK